MCVVKMLNTHTVVRVSECPVKNEKLSFLILIHNIFAITDALCYTEIHILFLYCRKWYSGIWVVIVSFAA